MLSSHKTQIFSLHFLPLSHFRKFENAIVSPTSSSPSSRNGDRRPNHTRENSYDSTIHHRRTVSRTNSDSDTPPPPTLKGFADFFHSRTATPISVPKTLESDTECWERMLILQREYHCYKSARLEAAVEAMEMGVGIGDLPMRKYILLFPKQPVISDYQ